jgi:regulator of nucleoside diphosphate kinase
MTERADGKSSRCCLTTKDHSILKVMLERRIASSDPILPLLRQKLAEATVVATDSVAADVSTLNSRVVFRVNGGAPETRTLVEQDSGGLVGLNLPITTARGLAMLGMRENDEVVVERGTGEQELILVEKVVYQPEAARQQPPEQVPAHGAAGRPALRLVHSAAPDVQPHGTVWKMRQSGRDDDDPGPSAA